MKEYTTHQTKHRRITPHKQFNIKNYQKRLKEREHVRCSVNGCINSVHKFSSVCYEHYKNFNTYGTYYPVYSVSFREDISSLVSSLKANKTLCYSDTFIKLVDELNRFIRNPYAFDLYLQSGAKRNTPASSKEKQAKWIKEKSSSYFDTNTLALRLIAVMHLYQEGRIESGTPLMFYLYRCIFTARVGASISTKECIGRTIYFNLRKSILAIKLDQSLYSKFYLQLNLLQ